MEHAKINAKYIVMRYGVDKKIFKPKSNYQKRDPVITFVGNLKERKGIQFLLSSMVVVKKLRPDIRVLILGNIDKQSKDFYLKKQFIDKNLLNVDFVGRVSEKSLIKHYQNATLNILPSKSLNFHFEGLGLIHLEAIACGTLSIGCTDSGNEDAIKPGQGFLVDYGDTKKLSEIILDIFSRKKYPLINRDSLPDWLDISNKYLDSWRSLTHKK